MANELIFEQITTGGCQSYLVGCPETRAAVVIDAELSKLDHYQTLAAQHGLRIRYAIDTHTHADHFSASRLLAKKFGIPVVMHRDTPVGKVDMAVDDGEMLVVGKLRLQFLHTPGHTKDSMCIVMADRIFTGDTLLIGGTGRTDLPTGDPEKLYASIFEKLAPLPPELLVYPAHDYKGRSHSTLGEEFANNPRLQKKDRAEFVAMMNNLNLTMPTHITEALRTNISGGKSVAQMLSEAADTVPFMSQAELLTHLEAKGHDLIILDVREKDAYLAGHIAGAKHLPRGQLELRVNQELPDPTRRILTYCELGQISTLAAATLREMGFPRAVAMDGGMKAWRAAGYPVEV